MKSAVMPDAIGATAGKVWTILHRDGRLTIARLQQRVAVDNDLFNQALGWLAREDKLHVETRGKKVTLSLK